MRKAVILMFPTLPRRWFGPFLLASILAGCGTRGVHAPAAPLSTAKSQRPSAPPEPLDPQKVQDQQDMTWADYHPIPGVDWADPARVPTKKQFKVALIAVDFDDQPFVITQPKKSDLFGNPQIDPVTRNQVPQFYADFYNKPSAVNHGHTINGYWMEQSRGQVGIGKLDVYGPYRIDRKSTRLNSSHVRISYAV